MLKQYFSVVFFVLFGSYIIGVHSEEELQHITSELEVEAPASQVWELYRHLGISLLAEERLEFVQSLDVLRGDGGLGTVIRITFVPGNSSYTEEFIVINDKKRVKKTRVLEGDCLAIGCSVEILRFDIIEKSQDSSIIRTDISYAVKKEFEAQDPRPNIQPAALAQLAKEYLENQTMARIQTQTSNSYQLEDLINSY